MLEYYILLDVRYILTLKEDMNMTSYKVRVTTIFAHTQLRESYDYVLRADAWKKMVEEVEMLKRAASSELTDIIGYHVQLEEITEDGIRRLTEEYDTK